MHEAGKAPDNSAHFGIEVRGSVHVRFAVSLEALTVGSLSAFSVNQLRCFALAR